MMLPAAYIGQCCQGKDVQLVKATEHMDSGRACKQEKDAQADGRHPGVWGR